VGGHGWFGLGVLEISQKMRVMRQEVIFETLVRLGFLK
jgi:hypothetical protein